MAGAIKTEDNEEEKEQNAGNGRIEVYSAPVRNAEYVIGTTTIEINKIEKETRSHIMETRFSDDPINQAGVNLAISLGKVNEYLGRELKDTPIQHT